MVTSASVEHQQELRVEVGRRGKCSLKENTVVTLLGDSLNYDGKYSILCLQGLPVVNCYIKSVSDLSDCLSRSMSQYCLL